MCALHENWFFPSSDVKNFQLLSGLVTSLDGKKPVFHAARSLGQNPGIANLVAKTKVNKKIGPFLKKSRSNDPRFGATQALRISSSGQSYKHNLRS